MELSLGTGDLLDMGDLQRRLYETNVYGVQSPLNFKNNYKFYLIMRIMSIYII